MLSEILKKEKQCDWDLLDYVNKNDPMAHCFPVWRRIYRLKWAISRALAPTSILEIGVRYGYSAFAFLDATPSADYFGIDCDGDKSGGVNGAMNWAEVQLNKRYRQVSIIKSDTQQMLRLPGDTWDLIHVDGQQDGFGTNHDLSLALPQARYILIDGYWWTTINFDAINKWLHQNKTHIEWHCVINDELSQYGDVLIKTRNK